MNKHIPIEIKGKNTDLEEHVEFSSIAEASACYQVAIERLLKPNHWHALAGSASANFVLTDKNGTPLDQEADRGNYIRIDIPGPGPSIGKGYDWVEIILLKKHEFNPNNVEYCILQVRPTAKPGSSYEDIAHFFNSDATSSFIIQKEKNLVTAFYYGRNETPNTSTRTVTDNIRNAFVAMGAFAFLSELQWKALLKGFLNSVI